MVSLPSEKSVTPPTTSEKKPIVETTVEEVPVDEDHIHIVPRGDVLPSSAQDGTAGYDVHARASLSSAEEKKLMRQVDWRLLPLLAVMLMLKSMDTNNVRSVPMLLTARI